MTVDSAIKGMKIGPVDSEIKPGQLDNSDSTPFPGSDVGSERAESDNKMIFKRNHKWVSRKDMFKTIYTQNTSHFECKLYFRWFR